LEKQIIEEGYSGGGPVPMPLRGEVCLGVVKT
jgi:hypothetical protein